MKDKILNAVSSPKELEALYQESPQEFQRAFPDVFLQNTDSLILQTWHERLNYKHELGNGRIGQPVSNKALLITLILIGVTGTVFNFFINADYRVTEWFFARIFYTTHILLLMAYFLSQKNHSRQLILLVTGTAVIALVYLILLPDQHAWDYEYYRKHQTFNDALTVVELHIPLFLWILTGVAFAGPGWRTVTKKMDFLRYNGELVVYLTLTSISVAVLSAITLGLLGLIENRWELSNWYMDYVIMYEVAAIPIVATFLIDKITSGKLRIAPLLGKIFAPLFLITTIIYLLIMLVYQKSPYDDRETLVVFNFLMLLVLGMSIFSIAERNPHEDSGISDYTNFGLIITTTIINLIALTAVVFRIFNDEYGLTPNRISILGINLLVFVHLAGILVFYGRFIFRKTAYEDIEQWITKYLPVYAIWAILISITAPLLFWHK